MSRAVAFYGQPQLKPWVDTIPPSTDLVNRHKLPTGSICKDEPVKVEEELQVWVASLDLLLFPPHVAQEKGEPLFRELLNRKGLLRSPLDEYAPFVTVLDLQSVLKPSLEVE